MLTADDDSTRLKTIHTRLPEVHGRNATIAIFGDWGTGGPEAVGVLRHIKSFKPDILLHLGDVYYSGTKNEMQSRFLDPINNEFGSPTPNCFSLCGNHDVYAGGEGYYWLLEQIEQTASYFALENENWLFIAMDTGQSDFHPHDEGAIAASLRDDEAEWVNRLVAKASGKKVVFFSHHPLFSAYEAIDDKPDNELLRGQLWKSLPRVAAWFCGHEHRLGIYQQHLGLERGRCLGHAAIPMPDDGTGDLPKFADVPVHRLGEKPIGVGSVDGVYRNGFAIMALDGPKCEVEYYSSGVQEPIFAEEL